MLRIQAEDLLKAQHTRTSPGCRVNFAIKGTNDLMRNPATIRITCLGIRTLVVDITLKLREIISKIIGDLLKLREWMQVCPSCLRDTTRTVRKRLLNS